MKFVTELSDVEGQNAHVALFEPSCPNEVGEIYACICYISLVNTTKLMRVEEAIG